MLEKRNCEVCDTEFYPNKKHPNKKTCSKGCYQIYRHREKRGLPIKTLKINCAVCGIEFNQKRSNNREYCGHKCKFFY